jgi:hypothetical protein
MNSYHNGGGGMPSHMGGPSSISNNMQLALVPLARELNSGKENIRVAVRVRPLLPNEAHREEVAYYPTFEEGPLQVNFTSKSF